MPADAVPGCGLEHVAKAIFEFHTKGCAYPVARSGAEWWVQVRAIGDAVTEPTVARDDVGTKREGPSIGFHWDMDLEVMRDLGLGIHPHLSTVTYLTATGASTAVASQRRPDAETGVRLRPRRKLCLSFPAVGKHFSFDGRYLHGAPAAVHTEQRHVEPALPSAPPSVSHSLRVTFLVNLWLGYTPAGVRRLDPSVLNSSAAATCSSVSMLSAVPSPCCEPCASETVRLEAVAVGDVPRRRFPVMWIGDDVDVELSLAVPAALPKGNVGAGRTLIVSASKPSAPGGSGGRVLPVRFEEDLCGLQACL